MSDIVNIDPKIAQYFENESNIPLVEINGTLWYHITEEEKQLFADFVRQIDRIPEKVWRKYTTGVVLDLSYKGNLAARVVKNSIIREEV